MKKHKKNTNDNIIEEAICLASKDPNNIVQAFSIIGIAMMDDVSVYVPVRFRRTGKPTGLLCARTMFSKIKTAHHGCPSLPDNQK